MIGSRTVMDLVIKSVQIKGNISTGKLTYKLCPSNEFSLGTWQVAISTICLESAVDASQFFTFTSNFCVSQRYSQQGVIESYQQPLATIYVNVKAQAKTMNRFSFPIWFTINRISDILCLKVTDSFTEIEIDRDIKLSLTLLFRKVVSK